MMKTYTSIVSKPYFCATLAAMLITACIIGGASIALADPSAKVYSEPALEIANVPTESQDDLKAMHAKISGADACSECHVSEFAAWKQSTHFATWSKMHKEDNAELIVKKMGYRGIKRNDLCLTCHYTAKLVNDSSKTISGVSCESCHGPSKDWIDVHNDYGGKDFNIDNETSQHKATRLAACDKAGMLRSSQVYRIAKNCYSCHTVPNEALVNVGGHLAGSEEFELVAWSQGEVRHNYFYSPDQKNRKASADHLRVLFVVGHLTDLEFSLRALSKAKEKGTYRGIMIRRINNALTRLDEIQAKLEISEVATALAEVPRREAGDEPEKVGKLSVTLSTIPSMADVADVVSQAIKAFAAQHDGSELAAIDSLLPASSDYRGVAQN